MPGLTLAVLAAGLGSRYGALKQLEGVGPSGERILDYSIYDALRAGFDKIVFVIRRDFEASLRNSVAADFESRVEVSYVHQEVGSIPPGFHVAIERSKPWGTAHAVLMAEAEIDGPFAVINADDFYGRAAFSTMSRALAARGGAGEGESLSSRSESCHVVLDREEGTRPRYVLVGYRLRDTLSEHGEVSRGVCDVDPQGRLRRVTERRRISWQGQGARYRDSHDEWQGLSGDELVSMNFWGFMPSIFPSLRVAFETFLSEGLGERELYLPSVVDRLVETNEVTVEVHQGPGPWYGLTHPDDKGRVIAGIRGLVRRGEYPPRLWSEE